MRTRNKDFLQQTIKEACPEFYNFLQNLSSIGNSLNKIIEPYRLMLEQVAKTPEFKTFIEACQYLIVKSTAAENFWAINDKLLLTHLKTIPESEYATEIVKYYSTNNYDKIQNLITKWQETDIVNNRIAIFQSCLTIMRNNQNSITDIANVVIPTLTAQLTGIVEDLYDAIPDKNEIEKELSTGTIKQTHSRGLITAQYLWNLKQGQCAMDCYSIIFKSVMINQGQFKQLNETDFEKYNKFRNKILHGDKDFLKYGTDENIIRSWLELDVAINTYTIINKINNIEV